MPTQTLIKSFVEAAPHLAWSNRPDGMTEFVNERFRNYVGIAVQEIVGDGWLSLVHPEDSARVQDQRNRGIAVRQPYHLEYRLRRADGVYRWHSAHVAPLRDVNSEIVGWYGSGLDIDDQRRIRESLIQAEARFRAVFESAAIGVARVAFEGAKWIEVNDAFCRILGYTHEELIGRSWPEITHPEDIYPDLALFERMQRGEIDTYTLEKRFVHKLGDPIWARLTLSCVRDGAGNPDFEVCLVENITERKQAEDALRRSHEDLERFSYVVSHDLKEPLRQVTAYAQLLARQYGHLNQASAEYCDLIVEGTRRMDALIRDLLLMAASEQDLPVESFESEEVVRDAIAAVQDQLAQHGGRIVIEDGLPKITAPRPVVRQVFQNLLANGLKYRQEERPPEIHIRGWRYKGEWSFSVSDNGQGIPAEHKGQLFQWFSRVPGTKASGNGIGLASIERMLQRAGGRIWVESEVGSGSTFHFTVPVPDVTEGR